MSDAARVTPLQLLSAVESLYSDQLRPYGRILRKRLLDRAEPLAGGAGGTGGGGRLDLSLGDLRAHCEALPWLRVESWDSGADWAALLPGRAENFVDVYSPEDPYPSEMWRRAALYFAGLSDQAALPGGRFACAERLMAQRLPFLEGLSLGQVCHVVQLAISHRRLLGYTSGTLVPYLRSETHRKDESAMQRHPCEVKGPGRHTALASWDTLRACLVQLLSVEHRTVAVSNVKRILQAHFQVELSETALGHAKLTELFRDARLRDLCVVRHDSGGYTLQRAPATAATPARGQVILSLMEGLRAELPPTPQAAPEAGSLLKKRAARVQPLCMEAIATADADAGLVLDGCADGDAFLAPATPSPYAAALAYAPPSAPFELPTLLAARRVQRLRTAGDVEKRSKAPEAGTVVEIAAARRGRLRSSPALGFSVQNTFIHVAVPPPTPFAVGRPRARAQSLPREGR